MKIRTGVGSGRTAHAAEYNPNTQKIQLFCNSLKYKDYYVAIYDPTPPTTANVTCKKCLKNQSEWSELT